jgi:hypothetical protein
LSEQLRDITGFLYEIGLRHPKFHLHFTPASSSWMNLAETHDGAIAPVTPIS